MTKDEFHERFLTLKDRCETCAFRMALDEVRHWCSSTCTNDDACHKLALYSPWGDCGNWRSACHAASDWSGRPLRYAPLVNGAEAKFFSETPCPFYTRARP